VREKNWKKNGRVGGGGSQRKEKWRGAPPPLKRAAFRVRVFFFCIFFLMF
jgi:hypothetical protein